MVFQCVDTRSAGVAFSCPRLKKKWCAQSAFSRWPCFLCMPDGVIRFGNGETVGETGSEHLTLYNVNMDVNVRH